METSSVFPATVPESQGSLCPPCIPHTAQTGLEQGLCLAAFFLDHSYTVEKGAVLFWTVF